MRAGGFQSLPITVRVPLIVAVLMVVLGIVASQQVLVSLARQQEARLRETARLHIEGLSTALGPSVLRQDVWEVFDTLDRARTAGDGQRLVLAVVADEAGRILAATDPRAAPVGGNIGGFLADAQEPAFVALNGHPSVRVAAPLSYQSRAVGRIVIELDVSDLIAERRQATLWLLFGNAAATVLLAFGGWLAVARSLRPVALLTGAMDETRGAPRPIPPDAIPRGDPGLARLIGTYNHMTEAVEARAEAERRLAARERFVSLGRLSSSLAHEINNPLGGLLNAADTIRTFADRPEVVRQSADLMVRGLQHMRDVTRAILDHNRLDRDGQPLRAEDFEDLRLLIEPETGHREQILDWQIDGHGHALAALPSAPVRQIVLNLLLNASAASGKRGRVGLLVAAAADTLQLAVRDDGSGLSPADLERLLQSGPLPLGGGVGLRLVHDLVAGLGGTLDHARGDGTTLIRVGLPTGAVRDA